MRFENIMWHKLKECPKEIDEIIKLGKEFTEKVRLVDFLLRWNPKKGERKITELRPLFDRLIFSFLSKARESIDLKKAERVDLIFYDKIEKDFNSLMFTLDGIEAKFGPFDKGKFLNVMETAVTVLIYDGLVVASRQSVITKKGYSSFLLLLWDNIRRKSGLIYRVLKTEPTSGTSEQPPLGGFSDISETKDVQEELKKLGISQELIKNILPKEEKKK